MTGSDVEREFINTLSDEYNYSCLRAPSSGAATDRDRPDAVCLKAVGMNFAAEIKKRPSGTVTFTSDEIDALERWARRAGVEAFVVVKPDLRRSAHSQWYVKHAANLHETEKGYSIRKQDHDDCQSISEVFG